MEERGIHLGQSRKQLLKLYENGKAGQAVKEKLAKLQKEMKKVMICWMIY